MRSETPSSETTIYLAIPTNPRFTTSSATHAAAKQENSTRNRMREPECRSPPERVRFRCVPRGSGASRCSGRYWRCPASAPGAPPRRRAEAGGTTGVFSDGRRPGPRGDQGARRKGGGVFENHCLVVNNFEKHL